MRGASPSWLRRRRGPRLSGTLHIRDLNGHELTVPLRGRAAVLTAGGTGLSGYGEVWAVYTAPSSTDISLMITYGPDGPADARESGLCTPGETVILNKVEFTWRTPAATSPPIPRPRPAGTTVPRNLRMPPAKTTNARDEPPASTPARLRRRLRNMVRVVTQSTRR